ncbi:MAG: hypothetical protein WA705_00085 [Candidatus Ozemobacteraceae bacterium]
MDPWEIEEFEVCAFCNQHIDLDPDELIGGKYTCPKCKRKNFLLNEENENTEKQLLFMFCSDEYYRYELDFYMKRKFSCYHFNYVAAILGTSWCLIKKLYWQGAFLLIADFLALVGTGLFLIRLCHISISTFHLELLAYFGLIFIVRIPFGFIANHAYFERGIEHVRNIRKIVTSKSALQRNVEEEGKNSYSVLLVFLILSALVKNFH